MSLDAAEGATRHTPGVSCHEDGAGRQAPDGAPVVALVGAPNVGKSTLFNALTGARRTVGNWPGTTVETGHGAWDLGDSQVAVLDLPGAYSLDALSPDEELTRDLLLAPVGHRPDAVVVIASAAHLARSLYLVAQLRETTTPVVVALTMVDVAHRRGIEVDTATLARHLGCPVVALDPRRRRGQDELARVCRGVLAEGALVPRGDSSGASGASGAGAPGVTPDGGHHASARGESGCCHAASGGAVDELAMADERFAWVESAVRAASRVSEDTRQSLSDRIDRWVTAPPAWARSSSSPSCGSSSR